MSPPGLSEALSGELSAFGIRVLIAEPGGMRTSLLNPRTLQVPNLPDAYKGTMADFVMQAVLSSHGKQMLDPRKTAEAIVKEVLEPSSKTPPLRMPLGEESLKGMKSRAQEFSETASASSAAQVGESVETSTLVKVTSFCLSDTRSGSVGFGQIWYRSR